MWAASQSTPSQVQPYEPKSGLVTQASRYSAVLMALWGCQKGERWKELYTIFIKSKAPQIVIILDFLLQIASISYCMGFLILCGWNVYSAVWWIGKVLAFIMYHSYMPEPAFLLSSVVRRLTCTEVSIPSMISGGKGLSLIILMHTLSPKSQS